MAFGYGRRNNEVNAFGVLILFILDLKMCGIHEIRALRTCLPISHRMKMLNLSGTVHGTLKEITSSR